MSNNKTLYVGVDAHSEHNTCCFMEQDGNLVRKILAVPNSLPGSEYLVSEIIDSIKSHSFNQVKIATEATSFYDYLFLDFLSCNQQLNSFNPLIYRFNPKTTKSFKKTYPDKDKTDSDDAFVIADRLRFGRLPEPYPSQQPYIPLQRLTRFRKHIIDSIAKEKTYFTTHLFLKFSSYSSVKPFSNSLGASSEALITYFTLDELASIDINELIDFLIKKGKNRFPDPEAVAQKIKKVARESYRIRPALASSIDLVLSTTIKNIRALNKNLKEINKAIEQELHAFPNSLTSVKGLGPIYTAGIIAEIGGIKRFSSQAQLAKFAGLTWRKTSSGNFSANSTRMTKTGNKYLRYYLWEAANSLRVHNEQYRHYYRKKYTEVNDHKHKRAVALCARKLVRLVFALLTKNQLYQA